VLSLLSTNATDSAVKLALLRFMSAAAQRLDIAPIRKELGPLVSIYIWQHLDSRVTIDTICSRYSALARMWTKAEKKLKKKDPKIVFAANWLYSMIINFLEQLYAPKADLSYMNQFLEFLVTLLTQLPTRRFVNTLLQDLNLTAIIRISPLGPSLYQPLVELLSFYIFFPFNDFTGTQLTDDEHQRIKSNKLKHLRETAYTKFPTKLKLMGFSNLASLSDPVNLHDHLETLNDNELSDFAKDLGIRLFNPAGSSFDNEVIIEYFVERYRNRPSLLEQIEELHCLPTEELLFDKSSNNENVENDEIPASFHRMALQYLSVQDFLVRGFHLARTESFYQIRSDIEAILKRIKPELVETFVKDEEGDDVPVNQLQLNGSSKRAALLASPPSILELTPARIGMSGRVPGSVKAEIQLDISNSARKGLGRDFDTLRRDEIIFLAEATTPRPSSNFPNERLGLTTLRTARIADVFDARGRSFFRRGGANDSLEGEDDHAESNHARAKTLIVYLDPIQYSRDDKNVYKGINLVLKRNQRENNFYSILSTVKDLIIGNGDGELELPEWLADIFLGFGQPDMASFNKMREFFLDPSSDLKSMPNNKLVGFPQNIEFPDIFATYQDITNYDRAILDESNSENQDNEIKPPYFLNLNDNGTIKAHSGYRDNAWAPNMFYNNDSRLSFDRKQIDAIIAGTFPGLTLVEGPPATGKTTVGVEIIKNIYHDFKKERTLVITHSNQTLDRIFEGLSKYPNLKNHQVLRLGSGEEKILGKTRQQFTAMGRVESINGFRQSLFEKVHRLVICLNLEGKGDFTDSCDSCLAFYQNHVLPAWNNRSPGTFPFENFFYEDVTESGKPSPFSNETAIHDAFAIIQQLFKDIKELRPYEIISNVRQKANLLLAHDAKIVAMTSTYAAMHRKELVELGFVCDNVVIEEAAQMTELDTFLSLSLALGQGRDAGHALRRVVLIGDVQQNAPIVQNMSLRVHSQLDQSLFQRLTRLGVPVHTLETQFRVRPEIAALYAWRYPNINITTNSTKLGYPDANAGLKYTFQFVDVGDYQGRGETEPTPHMYQNLGEAEYAVGLYQYLRLLGYPAKGITILTAYAGQKALIDDVLRQRCSGAANRQNEIFGLPSQVATIDRYQGEENDIVIVSLVRTRAPGYLRDQRRMTVALSRARQGLYVLGRGTLLRSCAELEPVWTALHPRERVTDDSDDNNEDDDLLVVPGEMYGQPLLETRAAVRMQGLEHLGQYVYEMTKTRLEYEQQQQQQQLSLQGPEQSDHQTDE